MTAEPGAWEGRVKEGKSKRSEKRVTGAWSVLVEGKSKRSEKRVRSAWSVLVEGKSKRSEKRVRALGMPWWKERVRGVRKE